MNSKTNKWSLVWEKLCFLLILILAVCFTSCTLFKDPEGDCELLSVYKKDVEDVHYIYATLKISNTSDKNIYNSTVSLEAATNLRKYYKTVSLDITITPGDSIFIPIEMSFTQKNTETPKEEWNTGSFTIISKAWK